MPGALSKDYIIEKATELHGDKYRFDDRFVYTGYNKKTEVFCTVAGHGYFEVRPGFLIATVPQGCPKCGALKAGASKRRTTESFVEAAIQLHGDKYDYTETVYKTATELVTIKCKAHNKNFTMSPNHHLSGRGCQDCSRRKNLPDLFAEAVKIFGENKFDYSRITSENYKGVLDKVSIGCLTCNKVFERTLSAHISSKKGCPTCNRKRKSSGSVESKDESEY